MLVSLAAGGAGQGARHGCGNDNVLRWLATLRVAAKKGGKRVVVSGSPRRSGAQAPRRVRIWGKTRQCQKAMVRKAVSAKPAGRPSGGVQYPSGMVGLSSGVSRGLTLGLTDQNGYIMAQSIKQWEGRPWEGIAMSLTQSKFVCFKVGSHRTPWYILTRLVDTKSYPSLRMMLEDLHRELLPQGPDGIDEAEEYYKGLSVRYREQADAQWVAIAVRVIAVWVG